MTDLRSTVQQRINVASSCHWLNTLGIGVALWFGTVAAIRPEWTVVLLLLSPFVVVPLGLRLTAGIDSGLRTPVLGNAAALAPALALSAGASFIPDPGLLAGVLSLPWLVFTLGVAATGGLRLLSRKRLVDAGIATDAGLLFLAVGGSWLTLSRAGLQPLGFSDAIVQLTAVHFHYAGFALPIVAGLAAGRAKRSALVPLAVIGGVPLTALGIVEGGSLEWIAATVMALAGLGTAVLLVRVARHAQPAAARWLTGAAGAALTIGMSLALGWAWSIRFAWEFLELDSMAALHGSFNAIGFALLGLVGLTILKPADNTTEKPAAASLGVHLLRPSTTTLEVYLTRARSEPEPTMKFDDSATPRGFRRNSWQRNVTADFEQVRTEIRNWGGHRAAGITLVPANPPLRVGESMVLAIAVGPITVTATCRITEVIDEPNRFGFVYATLSHHPEEGVESFIVTRAENGTVHLDITAVWRAATIASRLCPPVTRFVQKRTTTRYLDGLTGQARW